MTTRTIPASQLKRGDRITNSGTAVEGRTVAHTHEAWDGFDADTAWVEVTFTDGTTWDLDAWDAPVTIQDQR